MENMDVDSLHGSRIRRYAIKAVLSLPVSLD